jgi:hypothetical protein
LNDNDLILDLRIAWMRGHLVKIAKQYGLGHPLTLAVSERLDKLILEAQKRMAMVSCG